MERILRGVVTSGHPENLKRALFVKLASTVTTEGGSPSEEVKSILELGIELSLSLESSGFECFAGSLVLNAWGKAFPAELQSSLTPEFMFSVVTSENVGVAIKIRAFRSWLESLRQINADMSVHCGVVRLLLAGLAAYDKEIPLDMCSVVTDILHQFPACLPIDDALPRFVGSMIRSLSVATIEDVCVENIAAIAAILGSIWSGQPSLLSDSLNVIFNIISSTSVSEPTPTLASVVQFIPYSLVSSATEAVLGNVSITDEHVRLALQRMIDWLEWPTAVTVDKWVLAFLKALGRARKFSVLIHVTKGRVEQEQVFPVFSYILLSYQHSPDCFHKIVGDIPQFVSTLRENQQENAEFLTRFVELIHSLVYLHSGYPDLYEPVLMAMDGLPQQSYDEMKRCIAQNAWTAKTESGANAFSTSLFQSRSETGLTGLVNMGNTCYMNSVLQALFMEDEFYNSVLSQNVTPKRPILLHLQALFAFLTLSKRASYAPSDFYCLTRPPWFRQGLQQDCSEFLRYLLDQLHEEECALGDSSESLVKKHFMGMFQIVCVCDSCGSQSSMEEPFTEMALAVPDKNRSPDSLLLPRLIDNFLAVETLTGIDQYFCDTCQQLRDAHRQVMVKDTPQCLILSLKRFAYNVETKTRSKVLREVTCPLILELPILGNGSGHSVQFILSSIVVHSGVSSDCGHYYTYARHSAEAKKAHKVDSVEAVDQRHSSDGWFLFNDSHVTCSSFKSICNLTKRFSKDTAYLLLYNILTDDGIQVSERVSQLPKDFIDLVTEDNVRFLEEQEAESKRLFAGQKGKWTGMSRRPWDDDSDDDSGPSSKGGPPGSCGLGGSGLGQQSNRIVF